MSPTITAQHDSPVGAESGVTDDRAGEVDHRVDADELLEDGRTDADQHQRAHLQSTSG
ncbi:MAG TPA: hypothetical protein VFJ12_15605 [Segeticoccus sp.]|nr:hypothetical protein [Segeticoccus sp.]